MQTETKPTPDTEPTETTTDIATTPDLGDDKSFPHPLAPHTAEQIREWTRLSMLTDEPGADGVPPAFRAGVLGGIKDSLTSALPMLREAGQTDAVTAFEEMLRFMEMAGVE